MNSWHWLEMKKNKHWLQYVYDRSNGEIVAFLGFKTDARDVVQLADIVVLSSNRESFPLVMVEALEANKVTASTKCEWRD